MKRDIVAELKRLNVQIHGALPSLCETIAEFDRLRAEVAELRLQLEDERRDHSATLKAWDEERSGL